MSKSAQNYGRAVAFFDFDGTLTNGDSFLIFLRYVVGNTRYYFLLLLLSPVLVGYVIKLIPNHIAKQLVLKVSLSGYSREEIFKLGKAFADTVIPTLLHKHGQAKLQWHFDQGHECILVSASIDAYLGAWGGQAGFSQVLCTQLAFDERGLATGKLSGGNCFGDEKVTRIRSAIDDLDSRETYAYGDTAGDIPMLNMADHAFFLKGKRFLPWRASE